MNVHQPRYSNPDFFKNSIEAYDQEIADVLVQEGIRQQDEIELIASENYVSRAVMDVQGSVLTNKYAEGYPGRRYYGGCQHVDTAEDLARDRAKHLFNCEWVNVQPHSGAQANQAVFFALLKPGDTFMGLDLAAGGHLTHGSPVNQSGKWFNAVTYGVDRHTHLIDYHEVEALALKHKPKLIVTGGSAYPREINFARFREIADKVGAYLMVDMAHFAGLVAGKVHANPLDHADVVTTTTHKTLRGPRGGMILSNNLDLGKRINSAVFPGLQGGPLMHVIAAKAVAFGEALQSSFETYARQVIDNASALSSSLKHQGLDIVSGGTDTHVVLVDLRPKQVTGRAAEIALSRHNITCNKNSIPYDPEKPMVTSGIRLGTPAGTTRGFGTEDFERIGSMIGAVMDELATKGDDDPFVLGDVLDMAHDLTSRHRIY